ncbi:cytochrome P450 71A1-like [Curcuma longa]|uniref:cytochrome P450 71A1-like n=1 Tax=Curcuma longa TaxID=136217 RepID=UPI003D9EA388
MVSMQLSLMWPLFFLLLLLLLSFVFFSGRRKGNNLLLPNSPPGLPLIGNLHQLGALQHRSLASLALRHGPVMLLHLGRLPVVCISSASAASEVLKTHDLVFASRPSSTISDRLFYRSQDVAFAKYGDFWRHARRVCVLHLLSLRRVRSFRAIREEEVALLVASVRATAGAPAPVSEMITELTNNVLCRVAFGRKRFLELGGGTNVRKMFADLMTLLAEFPVRDFAPSLGWLDYLSGLDARVNKTALEFDGFIEKMLVEHETRRRKSDGDGADATAEDFVDILLSSEAAEGATLSRDTVKGIILDMFTAGTDTTYTTLEWVMAELIKHPQKMRIAQEEIRRIVGSKKTIAEETVETMDYLTAVIKEALRMHPPLPLLVPHEATDDAKIHGFLIPKGTRVVINAWAIGRDPDSWEQPDEFIPERFLNDNAAVDFMGQHFQLLPFGAGRRSCPGSTFAIATARLALANLLCHFDWELPNGKRGEELDMDEVFGVAVHKKSSLILVAKPRRMHAAAA